MLIFINTFHILYNLLKTSRHTFYKNKEMILLILYQRKWEIKCKTQKLIFYHHNLMDALIILRDKLKYRTNEKHDIEIY